MCVCVWGGGVGWLIVVVHGWYVRSGDARMVCVMGRGGGGGWRGATDDNATTCRCPLAVVWYGSCNGNAQGHSLYWVAMSLMEAHDLVNKVHLDLKVLRQLILRIEEGYNPALP